MTVHRTKTWKTIRAMGGADERQRVSRRADLPGGGSVAHQGTRPVAITSQRWSDAEKQAPDGVAARQTVEVEGATPGAATQWVGRLRRQVVAT